MFKAVFFENQDIEDQESGYLLSDGDEILWSCKNYQYSTTSEEKFANSTEHAPKILIFY